MLLKTWMKNVNEIIPVRWWSTKSGIPVSYLNELKRGSKDNPSLSHLQVIARTVGHDVYILPRHAQDHQYHLYPYLLQLMNAWISVQYVRTLWIEDQQEGGIFLDDDPDKQDYIADCEKALDLLIFFCNELDYSAMEYILKADRELQNFDFTIEEDVMVEWPFDWGNYAMGLVHSHAATLLEYTLESDIRKVLTLLRYLGVDTKDVLNGTNNPFYPTNYEETIQRCENADEVPSANAGNKSTSISG